MAASDEQTGLPEIETILAGAREKYETSTDFTLGIEEEFAILDPVSLDLVPAFTQLSDLAVTGGLAENVTGELLASEIEFRTGRCDDYAAAVSELTHIRARVAELMRDGGYAAAAAGTHPWADYREQRNIDTPYYQRLIHLLQYVAHRNNTFGLHVHVGVRDADRAIAVADTLRNFQPLLLALSASSPFLDGRDSGMCSTRHMTFSRNFVRGNIAPRFGTLDGYLAYVRFLAEARSIESYGQMWWGVRPHLMHGTVEFRMFDGQPDVRDTLALAALASGTVAHLCALYDAGELPEPFPAWQVDENLWRAARYGTDGTMIDLPSPRQRPTDELLYELIERAGTAGAAAGLRLDAGLERARDMVRRGCSALVQRDELLRAGDLAGAYRYVVETTMTSAGLHV